MNFKATSAKLSGNPDSSGWSQTYDFQPSDPDKLALRGHLFTLISTSVQEQGLDTVVAGREILSRLHEEYYGKIQEKPLIALREAVKKVMGEFSLSENIQIAVVSLVNPTIYMAAGGGSSVSLFRKGILHKLIESTPGQVVAASGMPSDGDKLIIGTGVFFSLFTREELEESLKINDPNLVIESYAPFIHSQDSGGSYGVMVLRFDKEEQTDAVNPILIKDDNKQDVKDNKFAYKPEDDFNKDKISFFSVLKKPGAVGIYLKDQTSDKVSGRKNKTSLLVGVLLLLILSVSIFFGILQKKESDFRSTYESQLLSAEHELQESYNLYLLNPQRSRELFDQARSKVLGLSTQQIDDPNLEELKQKIAEGEEKILGQYSTNLQLFVDLDLFSEGFRVDDVSVSSDVAYVLDRAGKRIVRISLLNKRTENIAGPSDVQQAFSLTSYSDRVFVSDSGGLYELDNGRIKVADEGGEKILLGAYASNLYTVDKNGSMIYRYPATASGFGNRNDWLRAGQEINLSDAKNLVIDGMIWVSTEDNKVMKFSLGNSVNFVFKGVFTETEEITDIFTNEDCESLYILESGKDRVVVVGKDGEYKAQYNSEGLGDAVRLVVIEKEKKAFVITSDKIYFFDLKHLD